MMIGDDPTDKSMVAKASFFSHNENESLNKGNGRLETPHADRSTLLLVGPREGPAGSSGLLGRVG